MLLFSIHLFARSISLIHNIHHLHSIRVFYSVIQFIPYLFSLNSSKCYIFARSNGVIANAKLQSTFHCGLLDLLFQRRANELLAYRSKTYRRNSNSNPRNPDFRWSTLSWLLITSIKPDAIISLAHLRYLDLKKEKVGNLPMVKLNSTDIPLLDKIHRDDQ